MALAIITDEDSDDSTWDDIPNTPPPGSFCLFLCNAESLPKQDDQREGAAVHLSLKQILIKSVKQHVSTIGRLNTMSITSYSEVLQLCK